MSDVSFSSPASSALPDSVAKLMDGLRSRVKRYAALSGILILLSIAAGTFWITSILDTGWFALQRLELPVGIRVILLAVMVVGGLWLAIQHLAKPVFRNTKDTELALLLERRFPQFQDRLITTIEGNSAIEGSQPIAQGMLQRTVSGAEGVAAQVSADDVFNFDPIKKQSWVAGLLAASVMGGAIASPGSLQRWYNAFILCKDTYHVRTTALDFTVVAQPGERRLKFQESEQSLLYLHPRGADFELEMSVPVGKSEAGQEWVVPERVRLDITRFDGSRSRTYVTSAGSRTFRFILTRLQETVSIEVLAGDFRTRLPLRVESVTPPSVDSMLADCNFPKYTGLNDHREQRVSIMGSEVALPIGTEFRLTATSNKPLRSARIQTDAFDIVGNRTSISIEAREGYDVNARPSGALISEDGKSIATDFQLTLPATDSSNDSTAADGPPSIVSNTTLKFVLHDEDDIISTSPETLRVQGIPDRPPVIATRAEGVGNAITRKASIPMTGVISDDYGLMSAEYQFLVDDETNWRSRKFLNAFQPKLEYDLETAGQGSEFFRVQDLVTEGQTLALTIVATDGCTIPEANVSRAEPIVFRIVSDQELLSLLYSRELTLRSRFEEVIRQLTQIQTDLSFHKEAAERIENAAAGADVSDDRQGLSTSARLNGDNLRRQNNELRSISQNFEEIRQQLINNLIPPEDLAEDMNNDIITPMNNVIADPMIAADRSLSRLRVAATSGDVTSLLVQNAADDVARVISDLNVILENVHDMAEFHEIFQEGKHIHEQLMKLWAETQELQKKRAKLRFFE